MAAASSASSEPPQGPRRRPQRPPVLYDADALGRLVVRNTFLSVVSESDDEGSQPGFVRRSHTDSALCGPGHGTEYRPGSPSTAASTPWVSDCEERPADHAAAASERRHQEPQASCSGRRSLQSPAAAARPPPASQDDAVAVAVGASPAAPSAAIAAAASSSSCPPPDRETERADARTTLMMRNLPNSYTRAMFLEMLDAEGFTGAYDFVYLPMDFARGCNLGYAFVNLAEAALVPRFRMAFNGYSNWRLRTNKICQVTWSDRDQGLRANVKRYRNSPVMHASVPDDYKPILFNRGVRVPFPAPHGRLQRPAGRRA